MKLYSILSLDFRKIPSSLIPEGSVVHVGLISVLIALTDDEFSSISVPLVKV